MNSSTPTATFSVPEMSCDHCKAAITEEVMRVEGVERVEVDLEAKLVRVSGRDVDEPAVIAAIDDAGYTAARA